MSSHLNRIANTGADLRIEGPAPDKRETIDEST